MSEKTKADLAREAQKLENINQRTSVISGLNAMQRTALNRYLLHGNKTRAYEEAGYNTKYPDRAASRLFKTKKMIAAIEEYFHAEEMSPREAVAILSRQARGTMEDFIHLPRNTEGDPIRGLLPEIDLWKAEKREQLGLIKKIKTKRVVTTSKDDDVTETEYLDIELYDAQSAAEKIGRYHGLFGPKGTEEDPAFNVGMTVDEWRKQQAEARKEREVDSAETLDIFEDNSSDKNEGEAAVIQRLEADKNTDKNARPEN